MLFTAPDAGKYISGVILYDETIRQKAADGTPLVKKITRAGMIPGIKVDLGAKPLAGHPGETRSEEHTSELQSLMRTSYAVFCLKKKKQNTDKTTPTTQTDTK